MFQCSLIATAPRALLLPCIMNKQHCQVPPAPARGAFFSLNARGIVFSQLILRKACGLTGPLPSNNGLVYSPANPRWTRHAPLLARLMKTQLEQLHRDPRSRMWRSGVHTVKAGTQRVTQRPGIIKYRTRKSMMEGCYIWIPMTGLLGNRSHSKIAID